MFCPDPCALCASAVTKNLSAPPNNTGARRRDEDFSELGEETRIVLEENANIGDAVAEHSDPFHAEPEGEA